MKKYIGTKVVKAIPMNRQDYNDYRGWELPFDEDGSDEGMLVEYTDGGKLNHLDYEGYISWYPLDVFDKAYSDMSNLTFGGALEFLKKGYKVARAGWNGKGMWLVLIHGWDIEEESSLRCDIDELETSPWIGMKTADNKFVPWVTSQADVLAEDWVLVS